MLLRCFGRFRPASSFVLMMILFALPVFFSSPAPARADSCVDCHKDTQFRVTNKKLYDYYQEWKLSLHAQEGISCADCHGGNPKLMDKKQAHGSANINPSEKSSPVHFRNIPKTCATCHDDYFEHFRASTHYKKLIKSKEEQSGPNCVTCHASVNTTVLNVNTVRDACAFCHNEEKDNHPEIPAKAEELLSKFLSIHRFYRYVTKRGDLDPKVFEAVEKRTKHLFAEWHSFDLPAIEKQTNELLEFLKKERDLARARNKKGS